MSFGGARPTPSIQTKRFLSTLAWLTLTHIFTRLVTTSNYLVNDDFVMAEFMNGNFTGRFESNTVFMHPIIGSIISDLNSMNLNVPWFPMFLLLVQVLSLSSLAILDLNRLSYIFLVFFSTAHVAFATVVPSFTPAAVVTTSCGIALFLHAISKNSQKIVWIGFLLIALGGLIRFDGMAFAIAMFVVPTCLVMTNQRNRKNIQLRLLAPALILIAGIFSIDQTPTMCITQSECVAWSKYNDFNAIRGTFHGTSRMKTLEDELGKTNWSTNDYLLFSNFVYIDDGTFNLTNLEKIDEVVPNPSIFKALYSNPAAPLRKIVISNPELSLFFYPAFAAFIYFFIRLIPPNRWHKTSMLLGLTGWLMATIAAATIRFPARIHEPALISLAIFLLIWSATVLKNSTPSPATPDFRSSRRDLKILSSMLSIMMCFLSLYLITYSAMNEARIDTQRQRYEYLETNIPNSQFIVSARFLTDVDPWSPLESALPKRLLHLGWMTSSPHFNDKKELLGIDNIYLDLVKNKSLYFIGPEKQAILIAQYIKENSELTVIPQELPELTEGNSDLLVWRFS